MDKLHAFAMHVWLGMPVWTWALCLFLGALNELVLLSKKTRAQSIFQGVFRLLLSVPLVGGLLAKFPILGDVLKACAGYEPIATAESDALKAADAAVNKQKGSALLSVVIAIAAIGLFALSLGGCGTAGGQALGKCELGALPNAAEPVIAAVITIATNTASTVADLVALAEQVGPQQVACAAQAYQAWLASRTPSGARMLVAAGETSRQHALAVLGAYLAKYPAQACTGRARL